MLHSDGDALLRDVIRTVFASGERVAVFEPSPRAHTDAVLSVGAHYVDCGRGYNWAPRLDALKMVIGDGVRGVLLAEPNDPTGSAGCAPEVLHSVEGRDGVFVILDERAVLGAPAPLEWSHALRIVRFPCVGGEVFALVAPAPAVCAVATVRGTLPEFPAGLMLESEKASHESARTDRAQRDAMRERLSSSARQIADGEAGWLFVRQLGLSGDDLSSQLASEGFEVRSENHHTWRGGVVVKGDAVR